MRTLHLVTTLLLSILATAPIQAAERQIDPISKAKLQILALNQRMVMVYDFMPAKAQEDFMKFAKAQLSIYRALSALRSDSPESDFKSMQERLKGYDYLASKFEDAVVTGEILLMTKGREPVLPLQSHAQAE